VAKERGTGLRERRRSDGERWMEIARTSRRKGPQSQEKMKQGYRKLLRTTSGGQPGEALPARDCQRGEASRPAQAEKCSARPGGRTGNDAAASATSDPAGESPGVGRRRSCAGETGECVRAEHGSDPQGEGKQTDRRWQDDQDPGSGESDRHELRSV